MSPWLRKVRAVNAATERYARGRGDLTEFSITFHCCGLGMIFLHHEPNLPVMQAIKRCCDYVRCDVSEEPATMTTPREITELANWLHGWGRTYPDDTDTKHKMLGAAMLLFKMAELSKTETAAAEDEATAGEPAMDLAQFEGFTPGPWEVDGDAHSWQEEYGYATTWVETPAGVWMQDRPTTGNAMAGQLIDAKLIAAAPALLAELRRVRAAKGERG